MNAKILILLADIFLGKFRSQSPIGKMISKVAEMYHLAVEEAVVAINDAFTYIQSEKTACEKICFHWTPVYLAIKNAWRETNPELKRIYLGLYDVLDMDARMNKLPGTKKITDSITPIMKEFNDIFEWNTPEPAETEETTGETAEPSKSYKKEFITKIFDEKELEVGVSTAWDIKILFGQPERDSTSITKTHMYRYMYYNGAEKEIQFCLVDDLLDEVRY